MKKRFSIRYKLIIIFGVLILTAGFIEGFMAVRSASKAVTEKVEAHLIDKANDVAEVVDGRITALFQFLEGIARMPLLLDQTVTEHQKAAALEKEAAFNDKIAQLNFYPPS